MRRFGKTTGGYVTTTHPISCYFSCSLTKKRVSNMILHQLRRNIENKVLKMILKTYINLKEYNGIGFLKR